MYSKMAKKCRSWNWLTDFGTFTSFSDKLAFLNGNLKPEEFANKVMYNGGFNSVYYYSKALNKLINN